MSDVLRMLPGMHVMLRMRFQFSLSLLAYARSARLFRGAWDITVADSNGSGGWIP